MRFKKFSGHIEAKQAILRSECDVGLFQEETEREGTKTVLIYKEEISDQIVGFVNNSLGQLFNFRSFSVGNQSFMETLVSTIPEEVLTACA